METFVFLLNAFVTIVSCYILAISLNIKEYDDENQSKKGFKKTKDEKDKIFVENGKVYDTHYREILRSHLTPLDKKYRLINEIILSLPGEIELRGGIDSEAEKFLKEFFCSKIIFKVGNRQ